jgi:acetaldehyde dehydrogenase (acetylating)
MNLDKDLESVQQVRRLVEEAWKAQKALDCFSQQQIDAVVAAMAAAARRNAEALARLAVEETTYGNIPDKTEKNLFSSRDVYNAIKNLKTVGMVREDRENGIVEIAVPAGVVAAIIPCTNPTSTAIFKALIALKARNAIVMSPHPAAVKCIAESCRLMAEAAREAGAPEHSIGCLTLVSNEATQELMRHRRTAIILATGGAGLVRSAYSSGKPALGVGPGNVPAYVHSSANVPKAVADILHGKCFDNGTICSSEQHAVVDRAIADHASAEFERQGGHFLTPEQASAVAKLLILPNFRVNAKMVGQTAQRIAAEVGIPLPPGKRALIAPLEGVGREFPLSAEKLSPVLSFYVVEDWHEGLDVCRSFLEFGGMGHTMAVHGTDDKVIRALALELPAFRMVVNTPAPHGSIGYSTGLFPSMSLGCGTPGGNITSDNLSPLHLLNIKRLAYEQRPVTDRQHDDETARSVVPISRTAAAPASAVSAGSDRFEIERIVARFMAAKQAGSLLPDQKESQPADDSASKPDAAPGSKNTAQENVRSRAVDFVSEDDVRAALHQNKKIYVHAKTIITPAARDLGDPNDVFVRA